MKKSSTKFESYTEPFTLGAEDYRRIDGEKRVGYTVRPVLVDGYEVGFVLHRWGAWEAHPLSRPYFSFKTRKEAIKHVVDVRPR